MTRRIHSHILWSNIVNSYLRKTYIWTNPTLGFNRWQPMGLHCASSATSFFVPIRKQHHFSPWIFFRKEITKTPQGNHKNSPKESNLLPFGFTIILLGFQLSATTFLKMLYRAFENTPQRLWKCTVGDFKMFLWGFVEILNVHLYNFERSFLFFWTFRK